MECHQDFEFKDFRLEIRETITATRKAQLSVNSSNKIQSA